METFIVRMWLPDRPGALGAVASRIGAVRGDVVGIEILERGAGRAIDELVVALPEPGLVDLLVAEVSQVDGVDVEDVRELAAGPRDAGLAALATAVHLVEAPDPDAVLRVLCEETLADFEGDWAMALRLEPVEAVVEVGSTPTAGWVAAFVLGSRHLDDSNDGCPDDVAWADLPASGLALAVGRKGRPFRWRERRQLASLARIADRRLIP
ncbi:MAG TPA: hypothetical protein VKD67_03945 [Acidimicrobiales bacterium]|nr:hypothetical protein [Acidimicrobiales bacterium]